MELESRIKRAAASHHVTIQAILSPYLTHLVGSLLEQWLRPVPSCRRWWRTRGGPFLSLTRRCSSGGVGISVSVTLGFVSGEQYGVTPFRWYERRLRRSGRRHEALNAGHAQHPILSERCRPQFAVVTAPLVERQRPLGVVVHTRRVVHHRRVSENGTFNRQIKRFTYSASLPSANEVAVR